MTHKLIIKTLFSICLLANFYKANSMMMAYSPLEITINCAKELKKQYILFSCKDDLEYVEKCLKYGYIEHLKDYINDCRHTNPLVFVIDSKGDPVVDSKGDPELIKKLLSYCSKETINTPTKCGKTMLYSACNARNLEIVKMLLPICSRETINKTYTHETKCTIAELSNTSTKTALYSACSKLDVEIVKLLLQYGANVDQESFEMVKEGLHNYRMYSRHSKLAIKFLTKILKLFNLAIALDNEQDKDQFIENHRDDTDYKDDADYSLLLHRSIHKPFRPDREKQTLFSNLDKDNRRKNLSDTRIITIN